MSAVALAAVLVATPIDTRPAYDGPTYELEWVLDVPLVLLPAFASLGWLLSSETPPAHCAPLCDPNDVNPIDRPAAGLYNDGWRLGSDITLAAGVVTMLTFVLVDEGFSNLINDIVVGLESTLLANGTAVLMNLATRRPRPLLYTTDSPLSVRNKPESTLSFYSGHAAMSSAITTWAFSTLYRRNPDRILPWAVLGIGAALTAVVAVGRVSAGKHFPTDVITGVVIGTTSGFVIPALHDSGFDLTPTVTEGGGGVSASMTF